jgi:MFS transporter, ACS family, aldohexuronate transporter
VSAPHALVPSAEVLFALRVALGVAESPSFPGAAQTVRRALPASHRAMGYGLIFTGSSLGAMIAAPLAIGLNSHFGWRLAFVGTSLCGLLWLPLWLVATGGPRRAALEAVAAEEQEAPRPAVPWRAVLRHAAVQRAVFVVFLSAPAIMFALNWYAQLLVEAFGQKQNDVAGLLWFPPLLFDLGAVGFGAIAARRDRAAPDRSHVVLVWIGGALAATLALVPLTRSPVVAVILGGLSMAGGGAIYTVGTADMLKRVWPDVVARAGGCTAAAQSLSHVLFAPAVGAVLDRTHTYTPVLVTLGLLPLPGVLVWTLWPMRPVR